MAGFKFDNLQNIRQIKIHANISTYPVLLAALQMLPPFSFYYWLIYHG